MGVALREGLAGRYDSVVLYSRRKLDALHANESAIIGELDDLEALTTALAGVDVAIHLAAIPDEGNFEEILDVNIRGTYTLYEAARRAGVRRIVFASSNHVVGFYESSVTIALDAPTRPDSYYGVSKVFGESLARLYYDKWGLESACLRIGSFRREPEDLRQLSTWLSHRDGIELVRCAVESTDIGFVVLYGVSDNTRSWWENGAVARQIGFVPLDDAEAYANHIASSEESSPRFHGGDFVDPEYRGGAWRIDLG